MWKGVVLLCVLATVVRSQETTAVVRCVNHGGELPINTYIEECVTPPCLLPQLQDAVIHIIFKAPSTTRSMKTLATAYIAGSPFGIDYPLGDEELTCNFLTNTYCPVLQDEVIQYTLRMYIDPNFPRALPVTIEFRIVDAQEDEVSCLRVPVRIVSPVTQQAEQGSEPVNVKAS